MLITSFIFVSASWTGVAIQEEIFNNEDHIIVKEGESIQAAIDGADEGDTILLWSGTYKENFTIDKPLILIGNGTDETIVDGMGENIVITVKANRTHLSGFTVKNSTIDEVDKGFGILVGGTDMGDIIPTIDCIIENIQFVKNDHGLGLRNTHETLILNNTFVENNVGLDLLLSDNNYICDNNISYNKNGLNLTDSNNNILFRNEIVSNENQAYDNGENDWDAGDPAEDGEGGNYWSDYHGENRGDGIGYEPYMFDYNQDNYPWIYSDMLLDLTGFNVSVENITAGESPIIDIYEAVDKHGELLEGENKVLIEIQNTTVAENLTFADGDAEYTWDPINKTGEYDANITIDSVTKTDSFLVLSNNAIDFKVSVEKLPAGEQPLIEIYDAHDKHDNSLKGRYDVSITIDDNTKNQTLTFGNGKASYVWDPVLKAGEYTAEVTIDEVTRSDSFIVYISEIVEFAVSVENITAGENPVVQIYYAVDEYENHMEGDYTVAIEIDGNEITEELYFESGAVNYTWTTLTDADEYIAEVTIDKVIEIDTFSVFSGEAYIFEVSVGDISAGEQPLIEIHDAEDEYENDLYGEYLVNITIEDVTKEETLFFESGDTEYIWDPISKAGEFTAEVTIDEVTKTDSFYVDTSDTGNFAISVDDITAGLQPVIQIYDAEDEHGNSLEGYHSVVMEIDSENINEELYFKSGVANYTWNTITKTGEYTAKVTIDEVTRTDSFVVSNGNIHDFNVLINNISAGEQPTIEIYNTVDEFDNRVHGKYLVSITIDGVSEDTILTFENGSSEHVWNALETAGDYVGEVDIGDVIRTDTFHVHITYTDEFQILINNITAGEQPVIKIYNVEDEYGNLLEGDHTVEIKVDNESTIEELDFDSGDATFLWNSLTKTGEYVVEVTIDDLTRYDAFQVFSGNAYDFNVRVRNISAGEKPVVEIYGSVDGYGNLLEGGYNVSIRMDNDKVIENLYLESGSLNYTWNNLTRSGEYVVEVNINGVVNSDNFIVHNTKIIEFRIFVDDITAGEKPVIEIYDAKDEYGNSINGTLNVTIKIDSMMSENILEFDTGSAEYIWEPITTSDEYTVEVIISEINEIYTFFVDIGEVIDFEIDVDDILAGETPNINIYNAEDEFGNLMEGDCEVTIDINGEKITEELLFESGTANYFWTDITEAGEYTFEVNIHGVVRVHSFLVNTTVIFDFQVSVESITAGEDLIIELHDAVDKYGNYIDGEYDVTILIDDGGNLTEKLKFTGGYAEKTWYNLTIAENYTVVVIIEGIERFDEFYVNHGVPNSIVVSPQQSTIDAGQAQSYTVVSYDEFGNRIGNVTSEIIWSDNIGVSTWTDNKITTEKAGTWEIIAKYGEIIGNAELTVEPGPIDSIKTSPSNSEITAGETQLYNVLAYDEFGNLVGDVTHSSILVVESGAGGKWHTSSRGRVYTSSNAGTWYVIGLYDTITDYAELTVKPGPIDHIDIEPTNSIIQAGTSVEYTAIAYDHLGNEVEVVTSRAVWSSKPEGGGYWEENVYNSQTSGNWTINAEFEDFTATTYLTVNPGEVEYLVIKPDRSTITAGETQAYTAIAYDKHDNRIGDVTEYVNWFVETGSGGNWTDNVYNSENPGEWTVTGNYEDIDGHVNLTVEPIDLIEFTPVDLILIVDPVIGEAPLNITISVGAENIGDVEGSIEILIDGVVVETLSISDRNDLQFVYQCTEPGEYLISFGDLNETVTVEEEEIPQDDDSTIDDEIDEGNQDVQEESTSKIADFLSKYSGILILIILISIAIMMILLRVNDRFGKKITRKKKSWFDKIFGR